MMKNQEWFKTWFDSPYYHLLYKNRDWSEARLFIEKLASHLQLKKEDRLLDLACGKGRHSIQLNKLGYHVTGIDLSKESISIAKQYENERLKFHRHDMRIPLSRKRFTHILNLFTSFGYFSDQNDNQKVLESVNQSLQSGGIFILDFLNVEKIKKGLPTRENKKVEGVSFRIKKCLSGNLIKKEIDFIDKGNQYHFEENVTAFSYDELKLLLLNAQFEIISVFGDYELKEYDKNSSDRLIFIAKKSR